MRPTGSHTLFLPDQAATAALAARLAPQVCGSATPGGHIHLKGELGAGKTSLARALLRECGISGRIKSPSYALLESYKIFNLYLHHFDFYRFSDPREWLDAGFGDLMHEQALILIEWPERAEGLLPVPDLEISLSYAEAAEPGTDPGREARLTAYTARGQAWLSAIFPPTPNPAAQADSPPA